jgi:ribose 5-phosphate isomerase B
MTIGIASDHAGFELKQYVKGWLIAHGHAYHDFGTLTPHSCDYPDYGHPLACAVERGDYPFGIAICGSGEGIAMTVNKHPGIRAGLCWCAEVARLVRQHNDANILVLPARFIDTDTADALLTRFFSTPFEGGRHQRRIDKIPLPDHTRREEPL